MKDAIDSFTLSGQAAADAFEILGGQPEASISSSLSSEKEYKALARRDIARRFRRWFLEAWHHPLWKRFIKEGTEDDGFYIGGRLQWSQNGSLADLDRLEAANRPVVSINHIQSIVNVLTGFERQNQYDLKAVAQGQYDIDVEDADQLSWLLKFVQDQTETQEIQSEVFEDGVVRGMGAVEVGINWLNDPLDGEIELTRLKPGRNVIWDPYWEKYDLSDARFILKYRWAFLDDLLAQYPEHRETILAATTSLDAGLTTSVSDGLSSQGDPADPYGGVNRHPMEDPESEVILYDPLGRRILIIEGFYREFEDVWIAHNSETGEKITVEDKAEADEIAKADKDRWKIVPRKRRTIRRGVCLPATYQTLDEDQTPYDNDMENYSVVPYIANRRGDYVYGVVRNLKDPQRVENKRMSQMLHILARYANVRPMAESGSLDDPRDLENVDSGKTIFYGHSRPAPSHYAPPLGDLLNALVSMATRAEMAIKTISGVNTDLLGQKSDDTSGIAIARRQAQGQTISTLYFDNLRRTRKLIGQRLARRIQQVMTTDIIRRITDRTTGETRVLRLNPSEAKKFGKDDTSFKEWRKKELDEGRPYVLRDVKALKFDVAISENPTTPSARQTALQALLELTNKMPQILPATVEAIITLADVPNRDKILEKLRRLPEFQAALAPPPPAPPAPPPEPEKPRISVSIKGETLPPDVTLALALGQTPPADAMEQQAEPTAAPDGAGPATVIGKGPAPGQPSMAGLNPTASVIPVPPGVAASPAVAENPRVNLPPDAGFSAGGPPPKPQPK